MSFEAERLIHDTPPTIEQLRRLASVGVRSAVAREKFRDLRLHDNTHYHVDELQFRVGETHEENDVFLPYEVRHRVSARIGVRQATAETPKTWSLKFFDTYFSKPRTPNSYWRAERSTYRFEWTRARVLMADRTLRLVGFDDGRDEDLEYYLDHMLLRPDEATFLSIEDDLRMISEADCDELIKDTADYFSTLELSEDESDTRTHRFSKSQ